MKASRRPWLERIAGHIGRAGSLRSAFNGAYPDDDAKDAADELKGALEASRHKEPPIVPFSRSRSGVRVVFVVVVGLEVEALRNIVAMAYREDEAQDIVPIFITDCDRFEIFRERHALFEYFPPPQARARFMPDADWELYLLRRLAIYRRKWSPGRIVGFGQEAGRVLAKWRDSPFEDETIGMVIAASAAEAKDVAGHAGSASPP